MKHLQNLYFVCNHQPKLFLTLQTRVCCCSLPLANIFLFRGIHLNQSYGRIGRQAVGKTSVLLSVKSNVLIQCQASGLRSNAQTFISPPWAISGGIRGPKETKSWWIELISPPVMDGPVRRGLENGSIVHLSLRLPCPSIFVPGLWRPQVAKRPPSLLLTRLTKFFFFSGIPSLSIASTPTLITIQPDAEKQALSRDKQT